MKIAVISAGNGGQAMAGHFGLLGHEVSLYTRNLDKISPIVTRKGVLLKDKIQGFGAINLISDNIQQVIQNAELIMVTSVANAHKAIAELLAPFVQENQIIVLNPGRTFGAIEFKNILKKLTDKNVYVAETQTLLYACRAESNGEVRIIGVKDNVPVAAFPSSETDFVLDKLNQIYPSFIKAKNCFETSLDNIGCIFHPTIVMFNAAHIERGELFYFYNDMTDKIASFIEEIDKERIAIAEKLGVKVLSVSEWLSFSYLGIVGETLCEKMKNNPAYYQILAPSTLDSRLLTEDIPTGILPLIEIAKAINVETPLLSSVYTIVSQLIQTDFRKNGRTLSNLGLDNVDIYEFAKQI